MVCNHQTPQKIPSNWRYRISNELCSKISKGTTPPKTEIVNDSGIPFLRVNNLSFSGTLEASSDFIFVSENAHATTLARSKAYPGDVLINIVGPPLGKVALLDDQYAEYNMNQAVVFFRVNENLIDGFYLREFLCSTPAQTWLQRRSKKTSGQQNLTIEVCKELVIPLPPVNEQKKIAQILSTWDKAITTTEQLLANSQQQKKALMQQLLTGKRRLPGFDGEWDEHPLSKIFTFIRGKSLSKSMLSETGKLPCILYGELYTKYGEVIDKVESATDSNAGTPSITGDILMPSSTTTSGLDLANATAILQSGVLLGGDIIVLRQKQPLDAVFMAHILTHTLKYRIAARAQGITIIHLYGSDLKNLFVQLPVPLEEQQAISSILNSADSGIRQLEKQLQHFKEEKKALMQQLLTGKRRVTIEDAAA